MSNEKQFLKGRVALVTGSGRGIGRALAGRLASLGAAVAVHDIDQEAPTEFGEAESLTQVAEQIADIGSDTLAVTADLGKRDQVFAMSEEIKDVLGSVDILVNNAGGDVGAGGGKPQPNDNVYISGEDVDAMFDRNLKSAIFCSQAVSPAMIEKEWGRIINIASNAAFHGSPGGSMYAIAKAGVVHFTRCLASQLRDHNVTVNCIAPGNTLTARFVNTREVDPDSLERTEGLNRLTLPEDLANVVEFFVSDLASFVSGQVISVDGGGRLVPG